MEDKLTECPYREVCKCPGYDKDEGDWVPVEGFIRTEEGVHCLDWDLVIPFDQVALLRVPEGRHIADAVTSADKIDEARRRWARSPKRKAAQRKYEGKLTGKATIERYQSSEKFRLSMQKYRSSEKGQEAYQKRGELVRSFRGVVKWLKENPGKTYEDFLKEGKSGS